MKFIIFIILISLCSCAVKIKNFDQYQKAPLLQLENMPTAEDLAITMPRVVVITQETENELAKRSNAVDVVRSQLILTLQNDKFVDIVERVHGSKVEKEITIAELEGKMASVESVDYIIKIHIDEITFNSSPFYIPLAENSLQQSGYRYHASMLGLLSIYEIPTMKLLKTISLYGSAATLEQSSSEGISILNFGKLKIGSTAKEYDAQIISGVVKKAVYRALPEVKKFLKKKSYILQKRTFKDKEIYAINRGIDHGIKSQDRLLISRKVKETNPITQEEEGYTQKICKGIVAKNTLEQKRAWVVFKPECSSKIRLGDKAVVQY